MKKVLLFILTWLTSSLLFANYNSFASYNWTDFVNKNKVFKKRIYFPQMSKYKIITWEYYKWTENYNKLTWFNYKNTYFTWYKHRKNYLTW